MSMFIALISLGLLLIAFGAIVLVRYSDRPGGTIKFLGLEVTSNGAGLPLVALGVACIIFAASRPLARADRQVESPGATSGDSILGDSGLRGPSATGSQSGACLSEVFAGLPRDRVQRVEVGMRDLQVIGPHQPLDEPFGLVLTEEGEPIGAMRLRLFEASVSSANLFRVQRVVDAQCSAVEEIRNLSRGGNPRELTNWDTARLRLGDGFYDLRIGGEGDITVALSRVR